MKMTNYDLVNVKNTLQEYGIKKLPQKISYAITRNLTGISKDYEVYDAQLKKIFEEYSDHMIKDENGEVKRNKIGVPLVDAEVNDEFNEQIVDLLNIEIDVDMYNIEPEVFDYDNKKEIYDAMSAQDIMILQSILCNCETEEQ